MTSGYIDNKKNPLKFKVLEDYMGESFDVDLSRIPSHIAIIMDGNGRWAQSKKKPRLFGHKAGAGSVEEVVEVSRTIGLRYLTLYAFSSENWGRPEKEVSGLMAILKHYLESELPKMQKNGIRLVSIGDQNMLPNGVRKSLQSVIKATENNNKLTLNLALSYGGRDEIVRAVKKISQKCVDGKLDANAICEDDISGSLDTYGIPDPDLLIRTGGEARLSNFLLWQLSYAEIYFTNTMWPDFREKVFLQAILDFQHRQRRFGQTGEQVSKK